MTAELPQLAYRSPIGTAVRVPAAPDPEQPCPGDRRRDREPDEAPDAEPRNRHADGKHVAGGKGRVVDDHEPPEVHRPLQPRRLDNRKARDEKHRGRRERQGEELRLSVEPGDRRREGHDDQHRARARHKIGPESGAEVPFLDLRLLDDRRAEPEIGDHRSEADEDRDHRDQPEVLGHDETREHHGEPELQRLLTDGGRCRPRKPSQRAAFDVLAVVWPHREIGRRELGGRRWAHRRRDRQCSPRLLRETPRHTPCWAPRDLARSPRAAGAVRRSQASTQRCGDTATRS